MSVIDSDQHLYESRDLWRDHIDPSHRGDALTLTDDELGYTWLTWRGERLDLADVHQPGNVDWNGDHRERLRAGQRSAYDYDELLPAEYWDPAARVRWLDTQAIDEAVVFPNYGCCGSDASPATSPRSPPTWLRGTGGAPRSRMTREAACTRRRT
jgi:hypothetical protein